MTRTTTFSIPNAALTALEFPTAATNGNDHGMFSGGQPTRITMPLAGRYRITFNGAWSLTHATSSIRIAQIAINGVTTNLISSQRYMNIVNNLEEHNLTADHRFAANDYIQVYVYHEHGSAINFGGAAVLTAITVERVSN